MASPQSDASAVKQLSLLAIERTAVGSERSPQIAVVNANAASPYRLVSTSQSLHVEPPAGTKRRSLTSAQLQADSHKFPLLKNNVVHYLSTPAGLRGFDLLIDQQYGFRKGRSAGDLIVYLTHC